MLVEALHAVQPQVPRNVYVISDEVNAAIDGPRGGAVNAACLSIDSRACPADRTRPKVQAPCIDDRSSSKHDR
jgi:hypothetical protein